MELDKTSLRIMKENRYKQAIFRYGVIPVLLVLKEYEEKQNFEECQFILNSINFINSYLPQKENEKPLPTIYSKEALKDVLDEFQKFGFTGKIFLKNVAFYIEKVKEMTNIIYL